jgi:hypothetical protein
MYKENIWQKDTSILLLQRETWSLTVNELVHTIHTFSKVTWSRKQEEYSTTKAVKYLYKYV